MRTCILFNSNNKKGCILFWECSPYHIIAKKLNLLSGRSLRESLIVLDGTTHPQECCRSSDEQ